MKQSPPSSAGPSPAHWMRRWSVTMLTRLLSQIPERTADSLIRWLELRVGVGAGGSAAESGETVALQLLRDQRLQQVVLFDVGANQGQYAALALKVLHDVGTLRVHCFEPSPATFAILQGKLAGDERLVLNPFGLGPTAGTATLYTNEVGSGLASLTQRRLDFLNIDHGAITEQVRLETLDDYCRQHNVARIDLLKIDVEGHELDVLTGGSRMFQEGNIGMVQFEFGGCNIDTRTFLQDFFRFFQQHRFSLFRICPSGRLFQLPKYRENDEKFRCSNFLAVADALSLKTLAGRIV